LWPEQPKKTQVANLDSRRERQRQEREREYKEYERSSVAWGILRTAAKNTRNEAPKKAKATLCRYLNARGITAVPSNALWLSGAASENLNIGPRFPAMVLPIVRGGKLIGAHVTWLTRDGKTKLATDDPRKMFGATSGGFIVLGGISSKARRLVIGEGVETTLSAMEILGCPGLAALNAGNLPKVSPPIKVKEIVIAADDDEAGRKAAEDAARRLTGAGHRVRIALPPDGGDWNDALCAADSDADLKDLREAMLDAPIFDGQPEARALTMAQMMALEVPPRQYLLKPWLETGSLNMMHGQRGDGKTWLSLGTSYAIAKGVPFLGWTPERAARVLYVDGELPAALLRDRLRFLGGPTDNLCILSRDVLWRTNDTVLPDLATPEGREFLDKIIEREQAEVIVLDSLSTLFRSGVENDAETWAEPQDWLMQHRFRGRSVIIVHHEGKSGTPRGTSKKEDTLDTIIKIRGHKDNREQHASETAFELTYTKSRSFTTGTGRPLIARLSTESGTAMWRHEYESRTEDDVIELLDTGLKQSEVAKRLKITKGYVSRIANGKRPREEESKGNPLLT
jgi:putative DNA primase/helicase